MPTWHDWNSWQRASCKSDRQISDVIWSYQQFHRNFDERWGTIRNTISGCGLWDERHFYVDHIFLVEPASIIGATSTTTTSKRLAEDERIQQEVVFDGSPEMVYQVGALQTENLYCCTATPSNPATEQKGEASVVASILTVRLTTTRAKLSGAIVTPAQVKWGYRL